MHDLYVGNLPYSLNENDIKELFEPFGTVGKVTLIVDKSTGKKRGYGFVRLLDGDYEEAINTLHESQCEGRTIKVNLAATK